MNSNTISEVQVLGLDWLTWTERLRHDPFTRAKNSENGGGSACKFLCCKGALFEGGNQRKSLGDLVQRQGEVSPTLQNDLEICCCNSALPVTSEH